MGFLLLIKPISVFTNMRDSLKTLTLIILLLPLCFSTSKAFSEDVIKAVTEDGRQVVLFSDGSWVFKPGKKEEKKSRFGFLKSKKERSKNESGKNSAKVPLEGGKGAYFVYYDDKKWHVTKPSGDSDAEYSFTHKEGDGYGMMIFERISIPLPNLKNIALDNARSVAPDARIISDDRVTVNGYDIMRLQMQGIIEGIPFTYYGYYASGSWGTLQFITYTSTPLFEEYKKDFTELLDGLNISG